MRRESKWSIRVKPRVPPSLQGGAGLVVLIYRSEYRAWSRIDLALCSTLPCGNVSGLEKKRKREVRGGGMRETISRLPFHIAGRREKGVPRRSVPCINPIFNSEIVVVSLGIVQTVSSPIPCRRRASLHAIIAWSSKKKRGRIKSINPSSPWIRAPIPPRRRRVSSRYGAPSPSPLAHGRSP